MDISIPTYFTLLVFSALFIQAQTPGQATFSTTCAACHGLDGRGGEHAPNIATSARVQKFSAQQLEKIVRKGIPAAGMPGFEATLGDRQIAEVLEYLHVLQGQGKAASLPGDPAHGRELFFGRARCGTCHMVAGQGGFMGADLTGYGTNHSAAEIQDAIVKPSNEGSVSVTTHKGQKYLGVMRNEDNFSLQLQTADGEFHFFDKRDLAHIEHPAQSVMPTTYGTELAKGELDDLINYLTKSTEVAVQ